MFNEFRVSERLRLRRNISSYWCSQFRSRVKGKSLGFGLWSRQFLIRPNGGSSINLFVACIPRVNTHWMWQDRQIDIMVYWSNFILCVYSYEQMKSTGQVLFDEVVRKLRLLESDYFDLEYTDVRGVSVSLPLIAQLHSWNMWGSVRNHMRKLKVHHDLVRSATWIDGY